MKSCHEVIEEADLGNHEQDVVIRGWRRVRGSEGYQCGVIVVTGKRSFSYYFPFLQFLFASFSC